MKRSIVKSYLLLFVTVFFLSSISYAQNPSDFAANELTSKEKAAGWVMLFDGKTSNGWRGVHKDKFPEKGWVIKDGTLTVLGEKGGDIITTKKYGDFDLRIEFRVKEHKANSGVKYYVLENGYQEGSALGLEFQTAHSPEWTNLKQALGGLYDVLPPNQKRLHPSPAGEWNQVRIVSKNNQVQHWLNGYKVLQYKRGGKKYREGVLKSKFKNIKNFGEVEAGYILLQDHNDEVSFRNIKIREL